MFIVITLSWNAITCFLESSLGWDRFLLLADMNWQQEKATNVTLSLGGGISKLQTFCEKKNKL